jgi:hypothetical protein
LPQAYAEFAARNSSAETLIVVIFGAYLLALRLGYVPDANFVIIACVMLVGLVIFVIRAVLWKEISWTKL